MPNQSALFRLDGADTTLLLRQSGDSVPTVAWFGHKLSANVNLETITLLDNNALPYGTVDNYVGLSLFPQASEGFMGSAALSGHRNSTQFAHQFSVTSVEADDDYIALTLNDIEAELALQIHIRLPNNSNVLVTSTTLKNTGNSAFNVDWLASGTHPVPKQLNMIMSHHGRWGLENQASFRPIAPGRTDISNFRGRTSHEHMPALICSDAQLNTDNGDALFAHLAWSGNFSLRVEQLSDGTQFIQAGVQYYPGEQVLAAGESLSTPPLMLTRGTGTNQCSQYFHQHARKHVLPAWSRTTRPVHANSWEALYFNHDAKELFSLVDAAASIGAERFVLDDGWFVNRRDDTSGLGDWTIDESIYPEGLEPLVNKVRSHGMQFGLWFEPEMVNPNSDLYRAHPEWALHVKNRQTPLARNQLALNIALPEVQNYLFTHITKLVDTYSIDYIKWDMNRDLVLPGNGTHAVAAEQTNALYKLLTRITQHSTKLEIETCSSGGARVDYGVLAHTARAWASDNIDPIDRIGIQQGFLRFYPPEIMGAHVGHEHAHLTGRSTNLHTRAIIALQGQYGFELDARKLNNEDKTTLLFYTELYKQNRDWFADASYWQLPDTTDALHASGMVAAGKHNALFSVITSKALNHTKPGMLRLRGLKKGMQYKVSFASANLEQLTPFNRALPQWCLTGLSAGAELLMSIGLPLPVLPPQQAMLLSCVQEAST